MNKYKIDTHTHTVSSGHAYSTVTENAKYAASIGLEIIGMTDHAPKMPGSCGYLHFLNLRILPEYIEGVRVLKGIELNILDSTGKVDMSERILKNLDIAIASLHLPCIDPKSEEDFTETLINVIKNTLGLSMLNVLTSWIPMMFAVFLCEIKSLRFRRFVQTFTTIPNFISWVLVYAIAIAIFSTDGFINTFMKEFGMLAQNAQGKNYLMADSHMWIKMWAWGTWKGVGWSAIIYIAGISGIDQSLYEAATVDGAGRFQKMWHVTLPGLLPTFFVLLLMSIANILTNGLDQYLCFTNAQNAQSIRVLDLYVYQLGMGSSGSIPLSTVVGMFKSVISVVLLFVANGASKLLRGESII